MAKSLYTYELKNYCGKSLLVIEDLNVGFMSVTNDIENVVEEISNKEKINPCQFYIIYKDSEGIWDGFDFSTQQFIPLQKQNWQSAAKAFIENRS